MGTENLSFHSGTFVTTQYGSLVPFLAAKIRWECEYCGTLNKDKRMKCRHCGAPRKARK